MASVLDYGADPKIQDLNGTPLHSLVWMRKPHFLGSCRHADPIRSPRQRQKMTALELAKKLLDKGADPNARIAWKEMPMTKGLGTTNPPNINLGRHYLSFVGSTAFYNAARNGDAPMMKLLVEHGADPKMPTAVGVTPLMAAACLDYYEGETPGPLTGVSEAERLEAVKLALDLGNDINAQAHLGNFKMTGTLEYMLAHYPDNFEEDLANLGVGDPRWDGFSALHGAVICNQPSILQYLVDRGAKLDIQSRLGWTPLTISKGIFMANSKKEFPVAAKILQKAMADKGIVVASRE
jgi:ankyrin repeat protein